MAGPFTDVTMGAPFLSFDGKYHYRYPLGDLPGAPASASGAGASVTTSAPTGSAASVTPLQNNFDQDFATRATGPGVIFAHNFEFDGELDYFIRTADPNTDATITNQSPKPAGGLTLVSTPFGKSRAIRAKAFGCKLTQDVPAANPFPAHDQQVWHVDDVTGIPDPAGQPYTVIVGDGAGSGGIETIEVQSVSVVANTMTVRRKMLNQDGGFGTSVAPPFPVGYTVGRGPNGSWNRPFAAFPAGQNGKPTPDIGIANGSVTKARVWTGNVINGNSHHTFREGYFGHRFYWDPSQPAGTGPAGATPGIYKNWLPQDGGGTRNDAWDGDELYIQFRAKISASRFALTAPNSKMLFIQNLEVSGSGQIFWLSGHSKDGEKPPPAEALDGVQYGTLLVAETSFGSQDNAPAGHTLCASGQKDGVDDGGQPVQLGYPNSIWQQRPNNYLAWCFSAERWITYYIHIKFGKDNSPLNPTGQGPTPHAPFASATDATYRTTWELSVAEPGDTTYKTLVSRTDFTWMFGDQKDQQGYYFYNPPGLNAFWMTQNLNSYVGGGSLSPSAAPHWIDYTQCIVSRLPIPIPNDLPQYMQGMADFEVRALNGSFAPTNGKTSMFDAQPTEWKQTGQPNGADFVFSAWSGGGGGDPDGLRLFAHGGGHHDSSNNGMHVFDFAGNAKPTGWSVAPNSQSALAAAVEEQITYSDGKPTAVHSYDGGKYDKIRNRYYRVGGSVWGPNGGGIGAAFYYDFNAQSWTTLLNSPATMGSTLGSSMIISPDGNQLLYLSSTKVPQFIDVATGALTGFGDTPWGSESRNPCALYDSKRNRYVTFDNISPARAIVWTINWAAKTFTTSVNPFTGANAQDLASAGACCFYDVERDLYWNFCAGRDGDAGACSTIYSVNPTTWAVTRYPLSGTVSMPASGSGTDPHKGGYNRFVWFPQWRMIGTVHGFSLPVSLIKVPLR